MSYCTQRRNLVTDFTQRKAEGGSTSFENVPYVSWLKNFCVISTSPRFFQFFSV